MKIEKTNLDSKGRVIVPKSFREAIGLRENDPVFVSLDEKNHAIILTQYSEANIYHITVEMGDTPGTLANLARVLFENSIDLISTESHSVLRTKGALWRLLCSSKSQHDFQKLKKDLLKNGATSVTIKRL